jgi:hypothetical protein
MASASGHFFSFLFDLWCVRSLEGVAAGTVARLPLSTQTRAVTGGWGSICALLFSLHSKFANIRSKIAM